MSNPSDGVTELLEAVRAGEPEVDLLALDPRLARLVEQRYSGGPTIRETAEVMTTSPKTVDHEWEAAKPWLRRARSGGEAA